MEKLKWQIHAETSVTQIMLWIILWKLFGGWVSYLAAVLIVGNIFTMFRSARQIGSGYFSPSSEGKK